MSDDTIVAPAPGDSWDGEGWKRAARDYHADQKRSGRSVPAKGPRQLWPVNYLLGELRCAVLRARLIETDLIAIGLALKGGLISPEQALDHLEDIDLLRLIQPTLPE